MPRVILEGHFLLYFAIVDLHRTKGLHRVSGVNGLPGFPLEHQRERIKYKWYMYAITNVMHMSVEQMHKNKNKYIFCELTSLVVSTGKVNTNSLNMYTHVYVHIDMYMYIVYNLYMCVCTHVLHVWCLCYYSLVTHLTSMSNFCQQARSTSKRP